VPAAGHHRSIEHPSMIALLGSRHESAQIVRQAENVWKSEVWPPVKSPPPRFAFVVHREHFRVVIPCCRLHR
jgi:hypothetical protein